MLVHIQYFPAVEPKYKSGSQAAAFPSERCIHNIPTLTVTSKKYYVMTRFSLGIISIYINLTDPLVLAQSKLQDLFAPNNEESM